jgi:hypothetical protein
MQETAVNIKGIRGHLFCKLSDLLIDKQFSKNIVHKKRVASLQQCVTFFVHFMDGQRFSGRAEGSSAGQAIPRVL